ncbi:hypothetical protein Mal64_37980 [Pseudobythopirellula maris]|uniref:Acyl-CoA dehydrogenase/oxidase N-terminal domain-containing protein n=1 Tax=Pseudobythopirellula maris TaxID=2527991 RepID=A0A5C5ZGI3_9BACT|nr:acyl-CoA dehydrogenase family protein [Pseudobythopirellula maris]TWT86258.1 hypothetical protein Mal64_37980 [Pseudobythopirellula maris]
MSGPFADRTGVITSPDDPLLAELCERLAAAAGATDKAGAWPGDQLRWCGEAGVFEWFVPVEHGGQGWSAEDVTRGYLALSAACLTTTFVITQRTGACRRIAGCDNDDLKPRLMPALVAGDSFATVGISHLTTSRRHLGRPVLTAEAADGGYKLDGMAPWVTGAEAAETVVVGATLVESGEPTERQMLVALPMDSPGVSTPEPFPLVAVTGSKTGPVKLDGVLIGEDRVMTGPVESVLSVGPGGGAGGHDTSTLAIGLATAAIRFLQQEAAKRDDLKAAAESLDTERRAVEADLLSLARDEPSCTKESLRTRSNSLVLRAAQASLAAAKGAGFVAGHPAGRWCREALFFLVWSCPQPVLDANLCELAGLE